MSVIRCNKLMKAYGKINAIDNLSLEIEENKITGLIGRNGAGKTTLLRLAAGYLLPTGGSIEVFGQNPFNSLMVSTNTIFVDDHMSFPTSFTLTDILKEAGAFYKNWDDKLAKGLFDYFSFNPRQRHQGLSKGMKSTFNSILGIASRCPLTIFDEPTSGMDSAVRKDFYRALLKDYLQYPRTIILSSHLLNELEDILEDILLIHDGTKRLHLSVPEFKEFAVGLRGNAQIILEFIQKHELIYKEEFAKNNSYVVVKNDFAQVSLERAQKSGIELLPVSVDELCVYLTAKTKGGIDDVFKRN